MKANDGRFVLAPCNYRFPNRHCLSISIAEQFLFAAAVSFTHYLSQHNFDSSLQLLMSHIYHPVSTTSATFGVNSNLAQEIREISTQKYGGDCPQGSIAAKYARPIHILFLAFDSVVSVPRCVLFRLNDARNAGKSEITLSIESIRELQSLDMYKNNGVEPKKGLLYRTFGQSYGFKVGHI